MCTIYFQRKAAPSKKVAATAKKPSKLQPTKSDQTKRIFCYGETRLDSY